MGENNQPMRNRSPNTKFARQLRKEMTSAEQRIWEIVRQKRCGVRFLRQHCIGSYIVDYYCAAARLVLEIDGSVHDVPDVRELDQARQTVLEREFDLRVVRLSNREIQDATDAALRERVLGMLPPPGPLPHQNEGGGEENGDTFDMTALSE